MYLDVIFEDAMSGANKCGVCIIVTYHFYFGLRIMPTKGTQAKEELLIVIVLAVTYQAINNLGLHLGML